MFIKKQRRPTVIMELIARTKQAVRALDNMNYKRMKKILVTDVTLEAGDDVSDPGDSSSFDVESNGPRDSVIFVFSAYKYLCKSRLYPDIDSEIACIFTGSMEFIVSSSLFWIERMSCEHL